jgi:DNA-binding SARP family transcriptional activator
MVASTAGLLLASTLFAADGLDSPELVVVGLCLLLAAVHGAALRAKRTLVQSPLLVGESPSGVHPSADPTHSPAPSDRASAHAVGRTEADSAVEPVLGAHRETREPRDADSQRRCEWISEVRSEGPPGYVRLLGRYEVEGPGGRVIGERAKDAWALLGLLAEFGTTGLPRETAYARMWPDADPRVDRELFWRPMREVRAKLCDAQGRSGRSGTVMVQKLGSSVYRINPDLFTCDVWQLRDALQTARSLTGPAQAEAFADAIELYRGPYLPDCEYEFARSASVALDREVVRAIVRLAELQDDPERTLVHLERACQIDTLDEYLYRRRMQIHADLGQVHAVRCCYQEVRDHLALLDLKPEAHTVGLYRRLAG